jgi:cysteine/histidine-rich domain-containing protein 1
VIAKGTMCKHQGCSKAFVDDSSRTEKCVYHPGAPVFHETMKMWSCCNQKAFEFDKFLSFPGCKEGVHKFVDTKQVNFLRRAEHANRSSGCECS